MSRPTGMRRWRPISRGAPSTMSWSTSLTSSRSLWPPAVSRRPRPGYEADDFLAAAVAREERLGGTAIVASGDRDSYQLASKRTTILQPIRAGEMARIGPAEVRARYGVDPAQVPDFIALRGDSSDRIPGAAGVGRSAPPPCWRYGSLEKALAAGRFAAQADKLRLYRSIATMDKTAPLPPLRNQKPTWTRPPSSLGAGSSKSLPNAWMLWGMTLVGVISDTHGLLRPEASML